MTEEFSDFVLESDFEIQSESEQNYDDEFTPNPILYANKISFSNNQKPLSITFDELDNNYDFIKKPFNEVIKNPDYIHLYFDFLDYLFDFHSGPDLVGKDIPELCHDGQGFLFHGCQNQNSHKRLQRHFTPASPRAQEYNFGIYFD